MLARPRFGLSSRTAAPAWPSLCAICHGWGDGRLCAACEARFAPERPRCRRCALVVAEPVSICGACLVEPPPYDAALARVDYAFPWDRLIAEFKFHAALDLAPAFARLIAQAHSRFHAHAGSHAHEDAHAPATAADLLVPVPLARARLGERGCNQAWEITRRLTRRLRITAEPSLLLRVRDTPHQVSLPPGERAGNVRGAFAIEPRRRAEVRGRSIAVVDDVMTTGSTMAEIARVLKAAGATRVEAWVLARTPPPGAGGA